MAGQNKPSQKLSIISVKVKNPTVKSIRVGALTLNPDGITVDDYKKLIRLNPGYADMFEVTFGKDKKVNIQNKEEDGKEKESDSK